MNMRAAISLTLLALVRDGSMVAQLPTIPVRSLSPATATLPHGVTSIGEVRALADGRILLNDTIGKQLLAYDAGLTKATIIADTTAAHGRLYPVANYNPLLVPYLADSSLLVDPQSNALLVIDPQWKMGHVMSLPVPDDAMRMTAWRTAWLTSGGNLIFQTFGMTNNMSDQTQPDPVYRLVGSMPPEMPPGTRFDTVSAVIQKVDFDARRVDSLTMYLMLRPQTARVLRDPALRKVVSAAQVLNPLGATVDEWTVTSGGDAAIVRGRDYHIDWYLADGKRDSTAKLPYDWHRLSDDEKQQLIDAVRRVVDSLGALGFVAQVRECPGSGGRDYRSALDVAIWGKFGTDLQPNCTVLPVTTSYIELSRMQDFRPPVRRGTVTADRDNNVWILPTTSLAAVSAPGPVYDVVNHEKGLFERVRLPVNRQIAGFGPGGVVYLKWVDPAGGGWMLERRRVVRQ